MMAKAKRTAKQKAATRKLVALNKRRRKKKTKTGRRKVAKRKTARRKTKRRANPKKTRSAKSHLWNIFKCRGNSVYFCTLRSGKPAWTLTRGDALSWKVKGNAEKNARYMASKRGMANYHVGIANEGTTSAQIAAQCKKGK